MGLLDNIDPMSLLAGGVTMMANARGRNSRQAIPMGLDQFSQYQLLARKQQQDDEERKAREEERAMRKQQYDLQMSEYQKKIADEQRQTEGINTMMQGFNGTFQGPYANPDVAVRPDMSMVQRGMLQAFPQEIAKNYASQAFKPKAETIDKVSPKDYTPESLAKYATSGNFGDLVPVVDPAKDNTPSAVREYQFAQNQGYEGSFNDWQLEGKRAGATKIGMPKIDIKMGESVAGQVGPMMKDSRVATTGAVKMFDAASRIENAIASGSVSSGPFTTPILTAKQLINKVSGGKDENIRQTRQVIKSLAQMSVEARKQLQGQGQVTESEAAAVAKADSGDINDLTIGELQDLVTLTKRAASLTARDYTDQLNNLSNDPATAGLAKFYKINGLEPLLKHNPELPQIMPSAKPSNNVIRYDKTGKRIQ